MLIPLPSLLTSTANIIACWPSGQSLSPCSQGGRFHSQSQAAGSMPGMGWRQPIDVSLSHQSHSVPLSLSPLSSFPPFHSVNINNNNNNNKNNESSGRSHNSKTRQLPSPNPFPGATRLSQEDAAAVGGLTPAPARSRWGTPGPSSASALPYLVCYSRSHPGASRLR